MTQTEKSLKLGVDIGGTFTDVFLTEGECGKYWVGKKLTTHQDPSIAVIQLVDEILREAGYEFLHLRQIIHGTTLISNALIERKGAKTALIVTEGFRDILEIARELRFDMDDLYLEKPVPLIPRSLRIPVKERVLSNGNIQVKPANKQLRKVVNFIKKNEIDSIAICLLHSYANSTNEETIASWIKSILPGLNVSLSCQVSPQIREFERMSTTVANAYVQPLIAKYLTSFENTLKRSNFDGRFYLMLSNGGICTSDFACKYPIKILESGPASGALAAKYYIKNNFNKNALSFDMGGTTAKVCLINDGQIMTSNEFEAAREYRFKKGSGIPITGRAVDMIEIGAGGGSIARINELGLLKVGPESAGSDPGPVCYGNGGKDPTVTDADLILGYLNPVFYLGGKLQLDLNAAKKSFEENISKKLKISVTDAAWGAHQIVNENMANAAKIHTTERGKDVRNFAMVAFGGAGPVHSYKLAQLLNISTVVIPPFAGVTSAFGFLCAPMSFDFVYTYRINLNELKWEKINSILNTMKREGLNILLEAGINKSDIEYELNCDMRFIGQSHEISVKIPFAVVQQKNRQKFNELFKKEYLRQYSKLTSDMHIEVLNWRIIASSKTPTVEFASPNRSRPRMKQNISLKGYRNAYFHENKKFIKTPVYNRYELDAGNKINGPAIIEENESTTIIAPHSSLEVDESLNLRINVR